MTLYFFFVFFLFSPTKPTQLILVCDFVLVFLITLWNFPFPHTIYNRTGLSTKTLQYFLPLRILFYLGYIFFAGSFLVREGKIFKQLLPRTLSQNIQMKIAILHQSIRLLKLYTFWSPRRWRIVRSSFRVIRNCGSRNPTIGDRIISQAVVAILTQLSQFLVN